MSMSQLAAHWGADLQAVFLEIACTGTYEQSISSVLSSGVTVLKDANAEAFGLCY